METQQSVQVLGEIHWFVNVPNKLIFDWLISPVQIYNVCYVPINQKVQASSMDLERLHKDHVDLLVFFKFEHKTNLKTKIDWPAYNSL